MHAASAQEWLQYMKFLAGGLNSTSMVAAQPSQLSSIASTELLRMDCGDVPEAVLLVSHCSYIYTTDRLYRVVYVCVYVIS